MKVQCLRCKEIVDIGDFRSSEQGIDITCVACGESYQVPAPRRAAPHPDRPAAAPPGRECPKCGDSTAADAEACARCGLTVDRFDGFERDREASVPDALVELWQATGAAWQDPEAHDRFVRAAGAAEAFRYAARCYREAQRERPGDAQCARQLAEIQRRAEAAILQAAAARRYEPAGKEPYKAVAILLVVLVGLAAVGTIYAFFLRNNAEQEATRSKPAKVRTAPEATRTRTPQ